MFYEAFSEYKNEGVFIKLMEEIQSMECSYFKGECYDIPTDCEKIDERRFRRMLKNTRILYSKVSDYDLAMTFIYEAFGSEKKYRYYKDEIGNIKNYLYAKSIDCILKNKIQGEITDENPYINKIATIESAINHYYITTSKHEPDDMTDRDITMDDLLNPAFKNQMLSVINAVENKTNAPLTNNETIAICKYKLLEFASKYNGIFDFAKFKSKQNSFKDFKEMINLLSYDYYCDWVKDFMRDAKIEKDKIECTFLKLPVDKIWDCVIADIMINSYIDICMWNDGKEFQCSLTDLYRKFDDDFIHYTSTENDEDVPLIKALINNKIDINSKVKVAARIRNNFRAIDKLGYVTDFFNHIPYNMKNNTSQKLPEFSMPMIFSLLMYKYSFGRIKSTASDVSIHKLCECINCYTEITLRNISMQDINQRDVYEAQCFIEKYLLNLVYNINGIIRYSSCNFTSDELQKSYYEKLKCNKHILTYQKLCFFQNNIDIDIHYFMNTEILNTYINIVTYMLTLIKASSNESYQRIINSFKLYLVNDSQSPKSLIPREVYMKDGSNGLSADDYAEIFGFDYYNTPKKRNKKYYKRSLTRNEKQNKVSTTESHGRKTLADRIIENIKKIPKDK